ncbi:fatty acid kinase binding subunit FakB1 [Staphylococcus simulans]|uniref:fatty acid kinase binding subunit FakB1 n=1 Tax=Staphylococcus simulans TaxID=1286 RepID=UPI000D03AE03|nr:fatty acid kinase binding subunit FakB1 [Staphylococcus simulans]
MKIAVMTDSTTSLTQALLDKYDISVVSLSVTFENGDNYTERVDLAPSQLYQRMKSEKKIPTTSQPAIGEVVEVYERLKAEGYTDVIGLYLSAGISGTYQSATQAGEMVDGINVHSFDSKLSGMILGGYVIHAAQRAKEGLSAEAIMDELYEMRDHTGAMIVVDDLKNLQKSGRITGAQAFIGTLLKMKPVLKFDDGLIVPVDKVRTKKRAIQRIEDGVLEQVKDYDEVTLYVVNGDSKEDGLKLYESLKKRCPDHYVINYSDFSPVIASHLGVGSVALGFTNKSLEVLANRPEDYVEE